MARQLTYCVLGMLLVGQAQGQDHNWIFQHNINLAGHYAIDQDQLEVTITSSVPGETFEFEARWGHFVGEVWEDDGPGDINLIIAQENAGEFTLTVARHSGRAYGARNVKEIDLSADDVTGRIGDMDLSQDLGELGPVIADAIVGDWTILDGTIWDDVVVNNLGGHVRCGSFYADLTVNGPGPHAGHIFIFFGDYSHSMFINGSSTGLIQLWGDLAGRIQITGSKTSGGITIGGALWAGAEIDIGNDLAAPLSVGYHPAAAGDIRVGGVMSRTLTALQGLSCKVRLGSMAPGTASGIEVGRTGYPADLTGDIETYGNMDGGITVWGAATGPITVGGDVGNMQDLSGIAIQGEGGLTGDITIDGSVYGGIGVVHEAAGAPGRSTTPLWRSPRG